MLGTDADRFQEIGLLVYLLPYIEQENLYRQLQGIDFDPGRVGPAWYTNPANWQLAQTRIKLFECPSDNIAEDASIFGTPTAYHFYNYRATIVPNIDDNTNEDFVGIDARDPRVLGRTNYLGCVGLAG